MQLDIDLDAWDKLPAQKDCYDDNVTDIIMMAAGLGSGKTHYLCRKMLKLSALNAHMPGGLLVPTYADFRKDIMPEFQIILEDIMGLVENVHYTFHSQHKEYRFIWSKAPLYVFTGEKAIAGPNLAYCGINEFSLIKWERVNEMMRRVRLKSAKYKQKCLAGTPEDVHGWLDDFVDKQEALNETVPNAFRVVHSDTSDNIHIDDNYRRFLESTLDEQSLKIFASGQIGVKVGSDYFYYSYDDKLNVTTEAVRRENLLIDCGLDFNVGKMAASFSHYLRGHLNDGSADEQHFFDEIYLTGDSNTYTMCREIICKYLPSEGVRDMLTRLKEDAKRFDEVWMSHSESQRKGWLSIMTIICDASGKNRTAAAQEHLHSNVKILRHYGFSVTFKSANPRLRARQLLLNGLFSNKRIKINPCCKRIRKDFKNTKQKHGSYEKDEGKNHELSHFSDGADYVIDQRFRLPEKPMPSIKLYQRRGR